jgi:NADH-quinone oxidoreductase subunit C
MSHDATLERIRARFPSECTTSEFRDNFRILVDAEHVFAVLKCLKDECGFDMLADLSGVDYLHYPEAKDRYGVIYCLTNVTTGERVVVKTFANDPDPVLPSCFLLWKAADWMEREVFDMYGVVFAGHPDLRRILMPVEFASFPLRKDYPLRGRLERHNFPAIPRAEG